MATFEEILHELGEELELTLHTDSNNTCLILFDSDTEVQIERNEEEILYGMQVGNIVAGKGRDALFKAALIANGAHASGTGVFSFSRQANQLVLFDTLPLEVATGKQVAAYLELMLEKGKKWRQAIRSGVTPDPLKP